MKAFAMTRLPIALGLWLLLSGAALAQNVQCATRGITDNSNACADTAFVQRATGGGGGGALGTVLSGQGAGTAPAWLSAGFFGTSLRIATPSTLSSLNVKAESGNALGIDIIGRTSDSVGLLRFIDSAITVAYGQLSGGSGGLTISAPGSRSVVLNTNGVDRLSVAASGDITATGKINAAGFVPTASSPITRGMWYDGAVLAFTGAASGYQWNNAANSVGLLNMTDAGVVTTVGAVGVGGVANGAIIRANGNNPNIAWADAGSTATNKNWDVIASMQAFAFRLIDDAYSAAVPWMITTRSANTPATTTFTSTVASTTSSTGAVVVTGGVGIGGALNVAGGIGDTNGIGIYTSTAPPAGGTTAVGYRMSSTANLGVFFGSGAPTLSAAKGSLYLRTDGTTTNDRMYVNTNGSTTWTSVTTGS